MLETLQMSPFGAFHTAISLVALAAGVIALVRDGAITWQSRLGKTFAVTTALTALTGFGIYHHGGFGKPHVLGILTLLVLGLAAAARRTRWFGRSSPAVEIVAYSAAVFFHMGPAVIETTTRFPLGRPLLADRDGPAALAINGALFLLFLAGAYLQVRRLNAPKSNPKPMAASMATRAA